MTFMDAGIERARELFPMAHVSMRTVADPGMKPLFNGKCPDVPAMVMWGSPVTTGTFWVSKIADDLYWVSDGKDFMAAAVPARIARYYRKGVRKRIGNILKDYLSGFSIPRGETVINFGANIGEVAVGMARIGMTVTAIEPDPNVLRALHANAGQYGFEVIEAAATERDGE